MISFNKTDHRIIGIVTIISGIMALASMVVGLLATNFDPDAFSNPVRILEMATASPDLLRWFMLLDMFGYYLLLLPVIVLLHQQMKQITPWATFLTACGYSYVVIGAIGASALAASWPWLLNEYRQSTDDGKLILRSMFLLTNDFIVKGMWNTLEVFLGGAWWIGMGLFAAIPRSLKITSILCGIGSVLDGLGEVFLLDAVAEIGLNIYLASAIIWAIWMGLIVCFPRRASAQLVPRESASSTAP